MACDKFGRLISLELDGRISPEAEAELMQHVDACERCAYERALQRRVSTALRHRGPMLVPAGLEERLADRVLREQHPTVPVRLPLLRLAAGLALAFVIGGAAGWWVDHASTEARAGANPVAVELALEAEAWRALGADDTLVSKILSLRRRLLEATASGDAATKLHLQAKTTAEILQLLPVNVADAWCRSTGVDRATFDALCKAGAR
jgi:anti-sigma factor RsiW